MKILLEIRYCGRDFHGWQVQPGSRTVQQTLQTALEALTAQPCGVTGCSRTDSGVHAEQFFCTVQTPVLIRVPLEKLPIAANALLPGDLAVLTAKEVGDDFHPRYAAKGKRYEYRILNRVIPDPFLDGLVFHYPRPLDLAKMREAAEAIVGTHDFSAFCAAASDVQDKVRTIRSLELRREGDLVILAIEGDGFLYNMVRIIAGTLIGVSEGRYSPDEILSILASRDRARAGSTAPACGLYLTRVYY